MSRIEWDAETRAAVKAGWLMLVGTVVLLGAMFWMIPHLAEDGALTRDDLYVVAGFVCVSLALGFPDRVHQILGWAIQGLREWRKKD